MRPSERLSPSNYKVPNNSFYSLLQQFLIDVIKETPSFGSDRIQIIDNSYHYKFSMEEEIFFKRFIVFESTPLEKLPQIKRYFDFDESVVNKIGQPELDFIDWIEKKPSMIAMLLGSVGWGKTTLLRHFFFYLIPKYGNSNAKKVLPIYIDLKNYTNEIRSALKANDYGKFEKLFHSKFLSDAISRSLIPYLKKSSDGEDEKVWEFIKEKCDPSLDFAEDSIEKIFRDELKFKKALIKHREKYIRKSEIYYWILKYLKEEKGVIPILIIDNADPISVEIINVLVNYIHKKCESLNIQAVISMRPETFYDIKNKHEHFYDTYANFRIKIKKPDPEKVLKNGLRTIKKQIKKNVKGTIPFGSIKLKSNDLIKISETIIDLLLSSAIVDFFNNITNGDLDNWAHLLKVYAQSGYLDEHVVLKKIITKQEHSISDEQNYFPQWIAFASIITHNYYCYFRNHLISRPKDTVINLFSNRHFRVHNQFIRIYLLNYFNKGYQDITLLKELYSEAFGIKQKKVDKAINFALRRLINCGLLTSPRLYKISSDRDVDSIDKLEISTSGKYYLNHLLLRYEYLSYMKDGCYIDDFTEFPNRIEIRSAVDQYFYVFEFLNFLFTKEDKFFSKMTKKQLETFISYFSFEGDLFLTKRLTKSMLYYGKNSYLNTNDNFDKKILDNFEFLGDSISGNEKTYLDG